MQYLLNEPCILKKTLVRIDQEAMGMKGDAPDSSDLQNMSLTTRSSLVSYPYFFGERGLTPLQRMQSAYS